MQRQLFFICPSDCLEPKINTSYTQENYFYTSLGNAVDFDSNTVLELKQLMLAKNIRRVFFMLSDDNRFIFDSTTRKTSSSIEVVQSLCAVSALENKLVQLFWKKCDTKKVILTNLMNTKIEAFKLALGFSSEELDVKGIIYEKAKNNFNEIQSFAYHKRLYNLN